MARQSKKAKGNGMLPSSDGDVRERAETPRVDGKTLARLQRELLEGVRAELDRGLAALRKEFTTALNDLEERLSIEDCRILATVAEKRMEQSAKLAEHEKRVVNSSAAGLERLRDQLQGAIRAEGNNFRQTLASVAEGLRRARGAWAKTLAEIIKPLTIPPAEEVARAPQGTDILAVCDYPGSGRVKTATRTLTILGWAIAPSGIRGVEALVDGKLQGHISYGALRQDVAMTHPSYPDAEHSGFVGTVVCSALPDGLHELIIRITAENGKQKDLKTTFQVQKDASAGSETPNTHAEYQQWLAKHGTSAADLAAAASRLSQLTFQPTISLIVPVFNTPQAFLEAMFESVRAQVYPNWELCLADDASTQSYIRPVLDAQAAQDSRIKWITLAENQGIAGASNAALKLATGEFIGLLDSDDVLSPLALFEVVQLLNGEPDLDLIYSDEDKIAETGRFHFDPFFKPDWSPDLLLSGNYINHFGVYRRALIEEIGGFRKEFEGSQDYDLVLRVTEQTTKIRHLPKVLYSWRVLACSGAAKETAKRHTLDAAQRALTEALQRRKLPGRVEPASAPGRWRVRYELRGKPAVTILMPSGGKLKYLEPCLKSVLTETAYPNFEVLVIDNSEGTDVGDLCATLAREHPNLSCRQFRLKPFNYSALNNFGIRFVSSPYVVLLNDDITVLAPDWIEAMLEHAQRPEVGMVGAKLIFPDDNIQHAGVVLGPHGNSAHAFKHFPNDDPGYYYFPQIIRDCSAVTFACAMTRLAVYQEIGGMDEVNLPVAFNDVDFCLRVRARGYWVVYTPYALLRHHESVTKTTILGPGELEYMRKRWGDVIRHDPFYNPNLTRKGEDYSLNLD